MPAGVLPALPLDPAIGGLLSVAEVSRDGANPDWSNGVFQWDSNACPVALASTDLCSGDQSIQIAASDRPSAYGWPIGIIVDHECWTMGLTVEERRSIVREQVELATAKVLEREVQTGAALQAAQRAWTHWLDDPDATSVGGPVPLPLGIAALEQALADCGLGAQGVIHMPRAAASLAAQNGGLVRDGDRFFTALGTPVAAGVGYSATIPPVNPTVPGPLPATTHIYATGPVAVRLAEMHMLDEVVDRAANKIKVTAARAAAVYWDSCCHFVATVNLA